MGYEFENVGFTAFATVLEHLGEDLHSAKTYITTHGDFGFTGEGILNIFSTAHSDAMGKIESQLDHLHEYFTDTLHGYLGQIQGLYLEQEDDSREKLLELERLFQPDSDELDRARASDSETIEPSAGFPTVAEPEERLVAPNADADDVYIQPEPNNILDHFSVQYQVRWIITWFADDPMDWLGKRFAGDWEAFLNCAEALDNLAECIRDIMTNFIAHVEQLEAVWSGNAYSAFNFALRDIRSQVIDGTVEPIERLAENYRDAARSAVDDYQAIEPIMGVVVDAIGTAGLSLLKNSFNMRSYFNEAVKPSLDDATGKAADALAAAELKEVDFTEVELEELKELRGSGNNLMLDDQGLPVIVDRYENL
ncbi:hypothetical protein BJF85_02030 [Saccharomonospora sp. CUA-673]|uniref:WXG100 family type VII secretion target n=1 Tax=Saccharomonospora sp. CUA-673 TaxID=1904969 RepID=UPI0009643A4C|nr:hypothetical protein [Saccharomonospora sp. CUA-673]OLT45197.1 hypothetical protein BJF85_02030 [Saccharomonospora sp. CUA-673]